MEGHGLSQDPIDDKDNAIQCSRECLISIAKIVNARPGVHAFRLLVGGQLNPLFWSSSLATACLCCPRPIP